MRGEIRASARVNIVVLCLVPPELMESSRIDSDACSPIWSIEIISKLKLKLIYC